MSQTRFLQTLRRINTSHLKLPQNSQLNIKSIIPVDVVLIPEWRDDGYVELEQTCQKKAIDAAEIADWSIAVRDNEKTGLQVVDISIHKNRDEGNTRNDKVHEKLVEETAMVHDPVDLKSAVTLSAKIPEKCNVSCKLQGGGNITMKKKLEGEYGFDFMTMDGNITIDKLRADTIKLESKSREWASGGTIHVKKSCEAQSLHVSIGSGGRLRAKMLNVSDAYIEVEEGRVGCEPLDDDDMGALIDIGSIYASHAGEGAHLVVQHPEPTLFKAEEAGRKIRVKSNHGHISASLKSALTESRSNPMHHDNAGQKIPQVELGGVNGTFDVSIEAAEGCNTQSTLNDNVLLAGRIHVDSLTPGQANILTSDFGDVELTLDRKIESDLRLLTSSFVCDVDPSLLLEEEDQMILQTLKDQDNELESELTHVSPLQVTGINVETDAFTTYHTGDFNHFKYIQGVVENKSKEPNSRFDVKTKGLASSVGKIKTESAAGQALQGFTGGNKYQLSDEKLANLPLIVVATQGHIKVESLSWIGAIERRYGIRHEARDLGRQAKLKQVDE